MRESGERGIAAMRGMAANDNPGPEAGTDDPQARVDAAVATLARLLGRRIAREQFDRRAAANDNAAGKDAGEAGA